MIVEWKSKTTTKKIVTLTF